MTQKTERLSLRLTPQQDALLRRAAEARGVSANDFIVRHAVEAAEMELADRRVFVLDDVGWDELHASAFAAPCRSSGHDRIALTAALSPLSGPMTLDSWISAAQGDPSGLWLLSLMSDITLPQSFTWGEFASIGMADAQPAERYFSSGAGGGSIIGNPFTEFLWGAGGLVHAWPANPGENQYTSVQNSNVPTLLIGGTLDFATPAQNATKELLPHLPNGHQVILSGLGHVDDFWYYEPKASTQLLTTFYDTGQVDTSRYTQHVVSFATSPTQTTQTAIAKDLLGAMIGFALLAALWLLWVARRVRKHGAAGPKTSFATRTIVPLVLGLGGWLGAALVVLTLWPALSLYSELLGILAPSVPIALGLYLAWTHRDWDRATKSLGLLAATAGALVGGWLGFTATSGLFAIVTTTIGAAAAGNLALIAVSLFRERSARAVMATTPPQPTVARSTPDRVEGLDHDLVVVGRVERGAP